MESKQLACLEGLDLTYKNLPNGFLKGLYYFTFTFIVLFYILHLYDWYMRFEVSPDPYQQLILLFFLILAFVMDL